MIYQSKFSTELGEMVVCATNEGICLLEFADRKTLKKQLIDLEKRIGGQVTSGSNKHIEQVKDEIQKYLAGELNRFSVPLDPAGTDFQKQVWQLLLKIPYGEKWSYLDQAKKLGNPKAVRAVATANGMNKIALIIPCHRVIGSDGSLTGYAGGLSRKKWLLEMEQGSTH